ncbi:EAL domain-containing protein [Dasania marina]|uniref:EAL domain-containing protein n=1 Tax=Dasania marina TaxID=471499 RepID=UPI000374FA5B|nr:EAL domain-containing protein [Dasania marina]
MRKWYFEGYFSPAGTMQRQVIDEYPYIIGREEKLPLTVAVTSVSRRHAFVSVEDGLLYINDMGSSNGTFVNHERISCPMPLSHGDVIHLGDLEMRIMLDVLQYEDNQSDATVMVSANDLSFHFPAGVGQFEELLARKMIKPAYQAIVNHNNSTVFGYELLGRGDHADLPESPGGLFQIAESVGLEVELSELFRELGVQIAMEHGLQGHIFVNTHPSEMKNPDKLMAEFFQLHKRYPSCQLVLEVHEQAITDIELIKHIKGELTQRGLLLSYDDFGVGQSRLLELVEAAPDVLKFDMMLVHDIHKAPPGKIELVQQLHQMSRSLGIQTLAECISQQQDYEVCQTIGFDFYQGFLFAKPRFINELM